jgi:hypothetical protein
VDHHAAVRELDKEARSVLSFGADTPRFIAAVEQYLQHFDAWQSAITGGDAPSFSAPSEKEAFRKLLTDFSRVHQQVADEAGSCRDQVASKLGDIRRRAHVLRSYIDQYPSRITITGKREG